MDVETVQVGAFTVPKEGAEDFLADCEVVAKAATEMMQTYCPRVERKVEDVQEGEAIIGYFKNGDEGFRVLLDPFEVPIMKMAMDRGTLADYILAKNGLTEEEAVYWSQLTEPMPQV